MTITEIHDADTTGEQQETQVSYRHHVLIHPVYLLPAQSMWQVLIANARWDGKVNALVLLHHVAATGTNPQLCESSTRMGSLDGVTASLIEQSHAV